MPPPRAFDPKRLAVVAVVEGIAVATVVLRFVLSNGAIALERPAHLAWFAGTIALAAAAVSHFVVRSSLVRLRLRREASPDAEDASGQIFALSVAIALGALAIAAVGPAPFEALLGGGAG